MAPETLIPPKSRRGAATAVRGASWMSLVAATTLGLGHVDQLRARVRADKLGEDVEGYRLIVQAYPRASLSGELPAPYARPTASSQRAVTGEELQRGIDVKLMRFDAATADDAVVVAWVERGQPDLEFDALRARPPKDAYYGVASDAQEQIVLRRGGGVALDS